MKLSEIKGERCLDVIADLIEPIANIAADPEASRLFKPEKAPERMTPSEFAVAKARECAPALLKGHRGDVIAILAALEGVSPEEYAEGLDMLKLVGGLVELLSDEALLAFLS